MMNLNKFISYFQDIITTCCINPNITTYKPSGCVYQLVNFVYLIHHSVLVILSITVVWEEVGR